MVSSMPLYEQICDISDVQTMTVIRVDRRLAPLKLRPYGAIQMCILLDWSKLSYITFKCSRVVHTDRHICHTGLYTVFIHSHRRLKPRPHQQHCRMPQKQTEDVQFVSTLSKEQFDLQHSTTLLRHCCWCGWGFNNRLGSNHSQHGSAGLL